MLEKHQGARRVRFLTGLFDLEYQGFIDSLQTKSGGDLLYDP